jgi:hypothetical protein
MHGTLPIEPQKDIFPAAQSGQGASVTPEAGSALPFAAQSCRDEENPWFAKLCSGLWPTKPAAALFYLTDGKVPERTCRAYASGEREPSSGFLRLLLRSSQGARVLDAIMRGSKQKWDQERRVARIRSVSIIEMEQRVQHELALE